MKQTVAKNRRAPKTACHGVKVFPIIVFNPTPVKLP
tara:strand:- start:17 stop:124 length:108 start_codon:yes stop_codon:yes gene_type:complete